MLGSRVSSKMLADWCRTLSSALHAGLPAVDAFELNARRGRPRMRVLSERVAERLRAGDDVATALRSLGRALPPLFLSMAEVATNTGKLPEVLRRLEDYYRFQVSLRRRFLQQIFWPAFQLVAAIFVIALLILIMGILADTPGRDPIDLLGLGLLGPSGAIIWLSCWFGAAAALFAVYWGAKNLMEMGAFVDRIILKIPLIGPCVRTLALARLCIAMRMTLDTGMSVTEAIRLSLAATDNRAFAALGPKMDREIRAGASLYETFAEHRIFPDEYLEVLSGADVSGSVPETMGRLSEQYQEEAEHKLQLLNTAAGWFVWLVVAVIIIYLIFSIFGFYVSMLEEAASGI